MKKSTDRVFLIETYEVNCKTIDQQFLMGFSFPAIYQSWDTYSAEQQYIIDNHLDEEGEIFLGISRL